MKLLEYYLNKALTSYYFQVSSMNSGGEEISKEEVTNFVVFFSIISIIGLILLLLLIATFCWFRYYYKLLLVNNKIIIRARIRNIPDIESQFTDYCDIANEKYYSEKQSSADSENEISETSLLQDAYSDLEIHTGDFLVVIQDVPNKDFAVA